MIQWNRKLTAACMLALLFGLASPLVATTDSTNNGKEAPKPTPVIVIETPQLKCWQAPPICNCQGLENCAALITSGYCKDGTYNFWEDENLGTCVWNGSK